MTCRLGESPTWDVDRDGLWWVDIVGAEVLFASTNGDLLRRRSFDSPVACLGLCQSGRLIVALVKRVILWDPETDLIRLICELECHLPENRLNDGKVGPDGCFWVGSMHDVPNRRPTGALYRIDRDGTVTKAVAGVKVSNGLAWTGDGEWMCVADSSAAWIDVWRFHADTGLMTGRRRLATLSERTGRPDGGAFDQAGIYWSAGVSAGLINAFDLSGRLIETWHTPISHPTMCAFGGRKADRFFVTSHSLSRGMADEPYDLPAGSLVETNARRCGVLPFYFDDRGWL